MLLSEVLKDDDLRLNAEALETIADNYPILLSLQRLDCDKKNTQHKKLFTFWHRARKGRDDKRARKEKREARARF